MGPSGVGKSRLIDELAADSTLERLVPDMTRQLRPGERWKRSVTDAEFDARARAGDYAAVNELYGNRYGTPSAPVERACRSAVPTAIVDYPLSGLRQLEHACRNLAIILLLPPSHDVLRARLRGEGREARAELAVQDTIIYEAFSRKYQSGPMLTIINERFDLTVAQAREFLSELGSHHARN